MLKVCEGRKLRVHTLGVRPFCFPMERKVSSFDLCTQMVDRHLRRFHVGCARIRCIFAAAEAGGDAGDGDGRRSPPFH